MEGVSRPIAFVPLAQGAGATGLASDRAGDFSRLPLAVQLLHQRDPRETLIQEQPSHANLQVFQGFLQISDNRNGLVFGYDKADGQRHAQVLHHHVGGRHAVEAGRAIASAPPHPQPRCLRGLAIVWPIVKVHRHVAPLLPDARRDFVGQRLIEAPRQVGQVFYAQFLIEVAADGGCIGRAHQVMADRLERAPVGRHAQQHVQQVIRRARVAGCLQRQMLAQSFSGVGQHVLVAQAGCMIAHGLVLRGLLARTYNPTRFGQARLLLTSTRRIQAQI